MVCLFVGLLVCLLVCLLLDSKFGSFGGLILGDCGVGFDGEVELD